MQVASALKTRRAQHDGRKSRGIDGQFTRSRCALRWRASRFAAVQPAFELDHGDVVGRIEVSFLGSWPRAV